MQIVITARDINLSDSVREFMEKKAAKLQKYGPSLQEIRVVASVQDRQAHVEVIADIEHGHDLTATAHSDDMLASTDMAVDKMAAQLQKLHSKTSEHHREPLKTAHVA